MRSGSEASWRVLDPNPSLVPVESLWGSRAHQCSRRACKNAERPSMIRRMATVSTANTAKMMKTPMSPPQPRRRRPMFITMVQSTSDSSRKARERVSATGLSFHTLFLGLHTLESRILGLGWKTGTCALGHLDESVYGSFAHNGANYSSQKQHE